MNEAPELHEVLYLSTLAPDAPVKVVATIAAQARKANRAAGITGLLVFDGMYFCQHIEGPRQEVLALIERIRLDTRHINVAILYNGPITQQRFGNFGLGYTAAEDVDTLARLQGAGAEAALDQFLALVSSLDIDD